MTAGKDRHFLKTNKNDMIPDIIKKWEENKSKLEKYFKTTTQDEYQSYANIVVKIFEICFNNSEDEWDNFDIDKLHIIDDGDYQGTQIFIIPTRRYQPCIEDYIITDTYYGSCSGCDTLMSICPYNYDKLPNKDQLKEYMYLSLHLVQKMRWLSHDNIQN